MMLTEAQCKILQPVVYTCRIFGLCPVSLKKIGNDYQLKYSPILVLYSCAVVIIFGIGIILGVRRDIAAGHNAVRMKSYTKYITLCDIAMVFMIASYSLITIPYRMKRFIRMIFMWNRIDKVIPISEPKKYRKYSIICIIGTVTTTTCLFLLDMFIYGLSRRASNDFIFFLHNYLSYYVLYFTLVLQKMLFWHLVFFIHIRIVSLNEQLLNEKKALLSISKKVFLITYPLNYNVRNKSNLNEENVKKCDKGCGTVKFEKSTDERIQELIKIFGEIKESVEILNDSASYGIVLLVLSCLLHQVVTPYFLLMELCKKSPSFEVVAVETVWFIGHVGRLLMLVEPCQRCLRDYKITTNLVSEMVFMEFDKETKKLLKTFSSQIAYSAISFNACGLFNIDRNLLASVAGAVTTYLVILFQFSSKDES